MFDLVVQRRKASPEDEARARALQAALAEFTGLRARMDVFAQAQMAVLTAGVAAIGVIAGFALKEGAKKDLLLLISVLEPILICTHSDLRNRIGRNGAYIGAKLWPYIQELTDERLPSWESSWSESKFNNVLATVGVSQGAALLTTASVGVLVARAGALYQENGYQYVWVIGALLTVVSIIYTGCAFVSVKAAQKRVPRNKP